MAEEILSRKRKGYPSTRKLPIDVPRTCTLCGKEQSPDSFSKRSRGSYLALSARCIPCAKTPPSVQKTYDQRRAAAVVLDPTRNELQKNYAAKYFQENKERIRLRNIEARKRDPEKTRVRTIANIMRRRALGCDERISEVRAAVYETLEAYRVGNLYWDAYESRLIEKPTIDHLSAVTCGGTNSAENLTVTSRANNSSKGTLPLLVWLSKRAAMNRKMQFMPDGVIPETQISC